MPRPPILEPVDYRSIWKNGKSYKKWLAAAESKDDAAKMEALRKRLTLEPTHIAALGALTRTVYVIAFAEAWCGDVHRHVPVIEKIAQYAPNLKVKYVERDEAPEGFKRFLTNGGEAVPKFVFFSDAFVECGNWGPMPEALRQLISRGKALGDVAAARKKVAALYEADPDCLETIREIMELVDVVGCTRV